MNNKSFTLIELIVVIAVIGLISSIILVSMKGTRGKARITTGLQFSQSINHALGAYAVGIWDFNDQDSPSTAHDRSGYTNHGTIYGAIYVGGPAGGETDTPYHVLGQKQGKWALSFDGVDDYVDCGDVANEDYDAMTIEAWIKRTSNTPSGWRTPLHRNSGTDVGSSVFFIGLETGSHQIVSTIGAGSTGPGYMSGATSIIAALGTWYHVVNSWDGATARVYVNGIEKKEYALTSANFNNKPAAVTRIGASGDGTGYRFNGVIDEVRIYERALSAAQIQQRYVESAPSHGIVLK